MKVLGKIRNGNQSCGIHGEAGVLQPDKGDEQADAHRNSPLELQRNGVENGFPYIGQGEDNKDDTLNENGKECHLPGEAHAAAYGIGHICIQSHAGGQGKWQICHQRHADRTQEGCKAGCQQDGSAVHTGGGENTGVDCQNIRHGHERGQTGSQLRPNIGFVCLELEQFLKHTSHLNFQILRCRADFCSIPHNPDHIRLQSSRES